MKTQPFLILILTTFSLLASCKKSDENQPNPVNSDYYYPPVTGDIWETANPTDLGWDINKLNELVTYVASNNSDGLIILYKGKIVTEKYWNNFTMHSSKRIFSATKSIGAFLVGLAQEKGKLDINKKMNNYLLPGWSKATLSQENEITIKQVLSMTSGLNENLTYDTVPGSRWFYNTSAYHKIYDLLAKTFNQSNNTYTNDQLWSRIGMQDSYWSTEPGFSGEGLSMSCSTRDMARFGLMILSDGDWNGTTLMTDKNYFQSMKISSQSLNPSYGYLWWLNGKQSYKLPGETPPVNGPLLPAAPPDLIAALGYADKKIYVVKSKDLVVARHGPASNAPVTYAASSFDNEIWKRLMLVLPK